jgi:hypothetical protein
MAVTSLPNVSARAKKQPQAEGENNLRLKKAKIRNQYSTGGSP